MAASVKFAKAVARKCHALEALSSESALSLGSRRRRVVAGWRPRSKTQRTSPRFDDIARGARERCNRTVVVQIEGQALRC
jgi:hypothetical protein